VTFFVLASAASAPQAPPDTPDDDRLLWLESWDRSTSILIGGARHNGPVQLQTGTTGLEVTPKDVASETTPGVPGSFATSVQTLPRQPILPLLVSTADQAEQRVAVQQLRDLTSPQDVTPDGSFRLVCTSSSGTRQVGLVYRSGLEGSGTELPWSVRYVLDTFAPQPYAEDRDVQVKDFRLAVPDAPFLAAAGTDHPWGTRKLSTSSIAGADTPVQMLSSVPVYPVIEITGPATSVTITGSNGLLIDVPDGVPDGSTLRIVTNPRGDGMPPYRKTIRLDGAPAAGMVARGSRFVPFSHGVTSVDVSAPGATGDTLLRLSWRGLHEGLW
jgi:hypothetical protein